VHHQVQQVGWDVCSHDNQHKNGRAKRTRQRTVHQGTSTSWFQGTHSSARPLPGTCEQHVYSDIHLPVYLVA
jgi:hypothetical protein